MGLCHYIIYLFVWVCVCVCLQKYVPANHTPKRLLLSSYPGETRHATLNDSQQREKESAVPRVTQQLSLIHSDNSVAVRSNSGGCSCKNCSWIIEGAKRENYYRTCMASGDVVPACIGVA